VLRDGTESAESRPARLFYISTDKATRRSSSFGERADAPRHRDVGRLFFFFFISFFFFILLNFFLT
jgi:hypothetical protein|tara:strand:+ start:667 stop:864 length:198 start_codon:yes stop_codon:yes gene_type:complete